MEVVIDGPAFYDPEDENVFFGCIYALPGYKGVKGKGTSLCIQFDATLSNEAIKQLVIVCRRWSINIDNLKKFRNEANSNFALWEKDID